MQQVRREDFLAGARTLDARALPVPVRRTRLRRATSGYSRLRILHGRTIGRALAIGAVLALMVGLYQARGPIGHFLLGLGVMAQEGSAEAGLAIDQISITGQLITAERAIFDALGIVPATSTVAFDVEAARQRIAELPAIDTVSVRKIYPGEIVATVTERVPVARWRVDGITFLIDDKGRQIGEDKGDYGQLPLVIGDGAADDALAMIRAFAHVPQLREGLVALSRIADRRWDMIYETGLRVQLPEHGVAQALRRLADYQAHYRLLERHLSLIDLRIDNIVAVRPVADPEGQTQDSSKQERADS